MRAMVWSRTLVRFALLGLLSFAAIPNAVSAQRVRLSQAGTVSQTVDQTEITVVYNRPVARGRTLFGPGGVVRYGRPWNPGADSATSITITNDVRVEGSQLSAGQYTLWAIPDETHWVVIFSRAVNVYHTPYPGQDRDALRVTVTPRQGSHMEVMAFYFPEVGPTSTTLVMHWGETVVPLKLDLIGASR